MTATSADAPCRRCERCAACDSCRARDRGLWCRMLATEGQAIITGHGRWPGAATETCRSPYRDTGGASQAQMPRRRSRLASSSATVSSCWTKGAASVKGHSECRRPWPPDRLVVPAALTATGIVRTGCLAIDGPSCRSQAMSRARCHSWAESAPPGPHDLALELSQHIGAEMAIHIAQDGIAVRNGVRSWPCPRRRSAWPGRRSTSQIMSVVHA